MTPLYTASAVSTGDARNGHVQSTDGILDFDVRVPKEMGGAGGATNPEQLFAAGYAACFHQALKAVGGKAGVDMADSEVVADVTIGNAEDGSGFQLAVQLEVTVPGTDAETAKSLAEQAHQMCPYSRATRGNIEVNLTVA